MKFKDEGRPFANVAAAEKKLLELANAMEADAGRLSVGELNKQLITAGASAQSEHLLHFRAPCWTHKSLTTEGSQARGAIRELMTISTAEQTYRWAAADGSGAVTR